MPRAKRRIALRAATVVEMSAPVEWELVIWKGLEIGGLGFTTFDEFETAWRSYRETILPAYIKAMPGSRPFGAYVTGEIPLPPIVVDSYRQDRGRRIGSTAYHDGRCYGHADVGELEHLIRIGLVDVREDRAARKRIDEHGCRSLYNFVSKENHQGVAHADSDHAGD